MKKRIHIRVEEEDYQTLERVAQACHFRGVPDMIKALVDVFMNRLVSGEDTCGTLDVEETNEIDAMFAELSDYMPTPFNTEVPKIHRYPKTDYEL